MRRRVRVSSPVSAGIVALALLLLLAGPAGAQTAPPPVAPAAPGTPGAASGGGSLMEQVIPPDPCPVPSATAAYPVSSYTIDYDEGGFTAVSRKAVGTLTELTFAAVRWVVSAGTWLVEWAFSFGFADRLATPMAAVAGRYRSAFFVPLVGSALLISAAYGGVQIFRGRLGRGLGEFALSLAFVAIFGTWLLSNPAGFLNGSLRATASLAGSVSTVALSGTTAGCAAPSGSFALPRLDAAVAPLTAQIRHSFIQQPYELLEWGSPVPPACAPYRDAVLSAGPGGDRTALVAAMNRPGCAQLYRFNRDPSTERLGVAVLVLAASGILVISLALVAGSVVVAQVVAVGLIALTPFAALSAALPGAARAVTWRWATALLRALTTIVVMSAFLTFLLLASDALLASTQGQSLIVQMAVLNLVAVLGVALRRRVARSRQRAAGVAAPAGAAGLGRAAPAAGLAPQVDRAIARARVGAAFSPSRSTPSPLSPSRGSFASP